MRDHSSAVFLVLPLLILGLLSAAAFDFQQCDRECRWHFGFYDRGVTGVRVGALGNNNSLGRSCRCYKDGQVLSASMPRTSLKQWDDADFWCGSNTSAGFHTDYVCVLDKGHAGGVRTTTRAAAQVASDTVIHCGKCAACSRPADVRVLYSTRRFITTEMTRCAAKFAKPSILGGDHDLTHLRTCLLAANISFDNTVRFDGGDTNRATGSRDDQGHDQGHDRGDRGNLGNGPTCMDCWTDNIMCDSVQCCTDPSCIAKFIDPHNTGAFAGCLKCDEKHCGAEFIKCAGANRRSAGIASDIARPASELCSVGFYAACSQCHTNCSPGNTTCNAKCELSESCNGPS